MNIDKILQDFKDQMNIQVLVTGKVGVGKQALVNQLIGENAQEKRVVKNGILITICSTPGLADPDLEDYDTLQNARGECREIDLFLFCIKITDRFERTHVEAMENITDIFGIDIWKKVLFVLTFSNTYKTDQKEQFVDKVKAWTQELRKRISKIIDPQVGNKVPVIPAGHEAPNLPDRASWISEFWIQGFRRMGFKAMVKLYIISLERTTKEMKSSQEMSTTPEEQPLIACYNTTVEDFKSKHQMHLTGSCVGLVIGSAIELIVKSLHYKSYIMPFIGAYLGLYIADEALNYFGWSDEKEVVDCHEEAIVRSLILAFYEEYPEYVNDDTYQKVKDKLDFKTVTKEEL